MTEIVTRAETVPEAEPRLSLSELQSLLRAAAEVERARRPVVLYAAPDAPATVPVTATQTLATLDSAAPALPVALDVTEPQERRRTLAEWLGLLGLAVAGGGLATMTALAVASGPGIADAGITGVAGLLVSLGAAVSSSNADDRNQAQDWTAWQETHS